MKADGTLERADLTPSSIAVIMALLESRDWVHYWDLRERAKHVGRTFNSKTLGRLEAGRLIENKRTIKGQFSRLTEVGLVVAIAEPKTSKRPLDHHVAAQEKTVVALWDFARTLACMSPDQLAHFSDERHAAITPEQTKAVSTALSTIVGAFGYTVAEIQ